MGLPDWNLEGKYSIPSLEQFEANLAPFADVHGGNLDLACRVVLKNWTSILAGLPAAYVNHADNALRPTPYALHHQAQKILKAGWSYVKYWEEHPDQYNVDNDGFVTKNKGHLKIGGNFGDNEDF